VPLGDSAPTDQIVFRRCVPTLSKHFASGTAFSAFSDRVASSGTIEVIDFQQIGLAGRMSERKRQLLSSFIVCVLAPAYLTGRAILRAAYSRLFFVIIIPIKLKDLKRLILACTKAVPRSDDIKRLLRPLIS
jgi:hypothetical protein